MLIQTFGSQMTNESYEVIVNLTYFTRNINGFGCYNYSALGCRKDLYVIVAIDAHKQFECFMLQ